MTREKFIEWMKARKEQPKSINELRTLYAIAVAEEGIGEKPQKTIKNYTEVLNLIGKLESFIKGANLEAKILQKMRHEAIEKKDKANEMYVLGMYTQLKDTYKQITGKELKTDE